MASIQNLKKDLNYIFSDLIEECYLLQANNDEIAAKAEVIIGKVITAFDLIIEKVNDRPDKGVKKYFQSIISELETQVVSFKIEIDELQESQPISE